MKRCTLCDHPAWENGLCRDHLGRDTLEDLNCLFDGCTKTGITRGYCKNHHNYMRKHHLLPLMEKRKCEICGDKHLANGLCSKHYQRKWKYGGPNVVKPRGPQKGCKYEKSLCEV